jgi:hypothetical protein
MELIHEFYKVDWVAGLKRDWPFRYWLQVLTFFTRQFIKAGNFTEHSDNTSFIDNQLTHIPPGGVLGFGFWVLGLGFRV